MTIASPWSAELAQDWVLDEWQPARWAVPWEQLADAVFDVAAWMEENGYERAGERAGIVYFEKRRPKTRAAIEPAGATVYLLWWADYSQSAPEAIFATLNGAMEFINNRYPGLQWEQRPIGGRREWRGGRTYTGPIDGEPWIEEHVVQP